MQRLYGSVRGCRGAKSSFWSDFAAGGMLVLWLFASTLYGHPPADAAFESGPPATAFEPAMANAGSFMPAPLAPSGLTATAVSGTKIDLTWTDNSGDEDIFRIERKTGAAGTYVQIATVGANVTTFSNTSGLSPNTEYFYRVRANNASGNSGYSNEANATTLAGPPTAPSSLTATAVSSSQINLTWTDNAGNEDGFRIERKTGAAGTYVQIATVGANVTTYSNTSGLSPNTEYFYRVRANNASGNSAYSNEASATTPAGVPPAPSSLTATAVSSSAIDLAWTDNAGNEDGFKIERKLGAAGTFAEIATVGANVTSFSSTGLSSNKIYFYQVRAHNASGNSNYSNTASDTTLRVPPGKPVNLTATAINSNQIDLAWTDNSSNEDGFKIERKTGAAGTYAEIATVGASVTSFSSTGLSPSTEYFYRARAFNNGGNSAYSNEASATTMAGASGPPDAPSGLTANALNSTTIDLAWTDNAGNEDGFKIERKNGAGAFAEIATVGANVTNFSSTGLSSNTIYFYRVRAHNASGNSAYSNTASDTTTRVVPPKPLNLTATAMSGNQIDLAWTDNSGNEDGFKIERKTGAAGTYAEIATVGANVTSFSSTGLSSSTEYFYRARAFNNGGNSAYSNETSATTLPDPPVAPSNLAANAVSNNQIDLTWTDNASDEDGFKIERKTGAAGIYAEIATVGANVTSYGSTGLAANTEYFYRVRASNTAGNSAYSNEANATTLSNIPVMPSGLAATPVSKSQINLAWTDNSSNEVGFKIERKLSSASTFTEIAAVGPNATSYSNTGLATNTAYSFRVRAYNADGHSIYSNEASATTFPNAPGAPSSLTATVIGIDQIDLAWQDNAGNELGFIIERKTGAGGTYADIDTVGPDQTSHSDTGLGGGLQYFYKVRAYNLGGNSARSNEANGTTPSAPPAAPINLTANAISGDQINLAWSDQSSNETGFSIELKVGPSGTYVEITTVGANVTSYSSMGLEASTDYFYRVRAFNGAGSSSYSNEANATTLGEPPASPSVLTATTVSFAQIDLSWTDNANNETGFEIERKLTSAASFTLIATVGANVTNYSSLGLAANTAYSYRVRAFNSGGNSSYSNIASATTFPAPPAAPSNLTATAVNSGQIDLAWQDHAGNELGFIIERKTGAGGAYAAIDTVDENVTAFSSTGLTGGFEYFYRVRAYNAGGNSAFSNEANATTPPGLPAAPSGLTANAVSNNQINLAWTDQALNEDGFKIEIKVGAAGTYAEVATVLANVTSYSSTGLSPGTEYYYRVRAYNAVGNSDYSNEANATTLADLPAAPSALAGTTVSNTRIDITWADNSNNEDGFKIERRLSTAATYTQIATVGADVTVHSSTGLTGNTAYSYRVRAFNSGGNSSYSNIANATTFPNPPVAPSLLAATAVSNSQINLSWQDNAGNELGFKIERKTGTAGTYAEIATVGANVTDYANSGLAGDTQYFYRVRAYNAGGNSAFSGEANAMTFPNSPVPPDNLAAVTVSNTQINLTWADSSNNEDGFKIERKTGAAGTYAQVATVGADVTNYSDNGLSAVTTYFYRVRAHNTGGHSDFSGEANATTLPNPPNAPGSLTATTISQTQINLAWTDLADNENGFKIERKTGAGGTYAEIGTVGANVTNYSDNGLSANTAYFYRVRAHNISGNSSYSGEANATTLPNPPVAPSSLTALTAGNTQIDLNWTDNADNEVGFKIERKTGAGGTYAEIGTVGANVTSFSNTGLAANTEFFYRVRAHNTGGHSNYSNEANATTFHNPPQAPGNLTATTVSQTQIDLAWTDSSSTEAGFKIERKTLGGTFAEIGAVGANVTNFSSTGLTANTEYFYRVRAFNAGGLSAYSSAASATTLPNPPSAPGSLTATTVSQAQINLAWADNSNNETGFKIERKTGAAGTYAEIGTVGANATSYSSTGLVANTEYFYRVRASNTGGNSAYSNEANATTLNSAPVAPSNLVATTISNVRIDLTWTDNSDNESGFRIERKLTGGAFTQIATRPANVTTYSNTGLSANTEYIYRVRANNNGGNSAYSNMANATTFPNPPTAPNSLAATTVSNTQIDLNWTDTADNETGFKIERKTGAAGTYAEVGTASANVTNYSDTGLSPNTEYFYRVRANNTGGNSAYSNEANATTLPNAPGVPSGLAATAVSNTQINLNWTDNADNETGFKIERKTGAAGTYAEIGTVGANVTSYSDNGLSQNTGYFYRVRASNIGGHSDYSNEANATTLPNAPTVPTGLAGTPVSNTQINLNWTDTASNEAGFKIERKTGAAGTYAEIGTTGANVTSYSDNGLSGNTQYFYRVYAHNTGGNSAYSSEANATTLPNPPATPGSSLTATTISQTQIDLAWADSSDNEDGFKIERKTGVAGTYAQIAAVGANVTSFSSTGLTQNTTYFYRVRAHNAGGHSTYSNEASATTLPNAPAKPLNLAAATVSNTKINLTWTDNSATETGFKIDRKTGAAGAYAQIATVGANVTSYANTALSGNTQYFYRIRSFNAGGNSAFSNEANATTLPNPPASPGSLTAITVSNTQINLAWVDSASNEAGFKIERKTGAAGTYAEVGTVGANVTSYSSTGLSQSTEYYYRVRAHNAGGQSNYTNEANATTAPNPPTGLAATTMSNTQINLNWTDAATGEDGFKIERKTGAAGTYAEIATVGANVTSYSNTGLSPNTEYFYRVRAHNVGGNSAFSNEANATTLPNAPLAPSSLTATTVSSSQIDLNWTDNADNEAGFKIERKTGAAGTYAEVGTVGANVTNYSDTGLSQSTEYYYRVRAHNTGGQSAYSNEANATTLPSAPSSLAATTISNTQIDLSWTDGVTGEDGFKIERKTGAAGTYAEIATVGANVTSYSNTGLDPITEYFYRVRAHNAGGHSAYSNEANATTLPNAPLAPSSLAASTVSNTQIDLTWTDNADNEAGFKIERKTGAAGTYAEVGTVGANVTNYSNTGLSQSTEYYYRVRAHNTGGNSAYSNEANATTVPTAPGGLTATPVSSTQIDLAWADSSSNEIGFKIERKTGAAGTYAEIGTAGANVTNYSDTGLSANTEYFYRVRAHDAGGHSAYSNEANATTLPNPPAAPSSLSATTVSSSQLNLAWTDNASNETGFEIERKTGVAGTYAAIDTVGANVTSFANTGLGPNTTYYYRVRAFNTGGNSAYSNEANATTLSGGNLALNKPATASHTDSTSTPARGVDGNGATYWRSGFVNGANPIAWLQVELVPSSSIPVGRAVVTWFQNYFAEEYDFQVSTDGTNWTTVYTNNAGAIGTQDFTFTTAMARFVRLYCKKNSKSNYRLAELEVYAGALAKDANGGAEAAIIPDAVALAQNYPNPFNPTTTISYALPEGMHITLKILNVAGQEVATLAEGYQGRGIYRIPFNASRLPSGVYFAVLKAGATVQTRRMILTK